MFIKSVVVVGLATLALAVPDLNNWNADSPQPVERDAAAMDDMIKRQNAATTTSSVASTATKPTGPTRSYNSLALAQAFGHPKIHGGGISGGWVTALGSQKRDPGPDAANPEVMERSEYGDGNEQARPPKHFADREADHEQYGSEAEALEARDLNPTLKIGIPKAPEVAVPVNLQGVPLEVQGAPVKFAGGPALVKGGPSKFAGSGSTNAKAQAQAQAKAVIDKAKETNKPVNAGGSAAGGSAELGTNGN